MGAQQAFVRLLSLLACLTIGACATPPQAAALTPAPPTAPPEPTAIPTPQVLIDADMGSSDIMAILYLLQHPEVEVAAITVAGTGEAHCEPGVRHALGLVTLAGVGPLPVACGREQPLAGTKKFPTLVRERAASDMGITWPEVEAPAAQPAAELLAATAAAAPQKLTLVALGPLTNVAEALQTDQRLAERLEMIYVMGGAFDVPGNIPSLVPISDNLTAEFNMYIDPAATKAVLESGAPVTFVPLDAAQDVPTAWPFTFYKTLAANQNTPAAKAVLKLFEGDPALRQEGQFFLHILAAVMAADGQAATLEEKTVTVSDADGNEYGRTVEDAVGRPARVAVDADPGQIEEHFLTVLNGGESLAEPSIAPPIVVTITDEGCAADNLGPVQAGEIAIERVVEGSRYGLYPTVIGTLDDGVTGEDLATWPNAPFEPPWFNFITGAEALPNSRSLMVVNVEEGPLYMSCLARPPDVILGVVGPIEVLP